MYGFENGVKRASDAIKISKEERASYCSDMKILSNYVMEKLKSVSDEFKETFDGLSLTGSFLDDVRIIKPDEFDFHVKLKAKSLQLLPVESTEKPGYIKLQVQNKCCHTFVSDNGFINRKFLQDWMRRLIDTIFNQNLMSNVSCNGRKYRLTYTHRGTAFAHTICAKSETRTINFDFVPAFEFRSVEWPFRNKVSQHSWFACPVAPHIVDGDNHFIMVAPHWEYELICKNEVFKDTLRLLKAIRQTKRIWHLSSYMLKTILLHELKSSPTGLWSKPLGYIVMEMIKKLIACYWHNRLEYYWNPSVNIFSRLTSNDKFYGKLKLEDVLRILEQCSKTNSTNGLSSVFGLNSLN